MTAPTQTHREPLPDDAEDALLRFEQAWEDRATPPNPIEFIPSDAPAEVVRELVHIDIERRRRANRTIDIAGYLRAFPQLAPYQEEFEHAARGPGMADTAPGHGSRNNPSTVTFEAICAGLEAHARGGLGEVMRADDIALGRRLAVKVLQTRWASDPRACRDFLQEAEITSRLEHPGIVPVHALGRTADGRPCYSMRFVEGRTLQQAISDYHRDDRADAVARGLEFRQLISRFVAVCNTVAYAHSRGVLHRDLKPANIMLGPFGETLVLDWGLSKNTAAAGVEGSGIAGAAPTGDETLAGEVRGTLAFLSPEQAAGDPTAIGPHTDVFGLGATLYALLTSQPPFVGETYSQILERAQAGEFPPPRSWRRGIPAALEAICLKAMARAPSDRYPSPLALAADLENWLADERVTAYREPWLTTVRRGLRRRRSLVAVMLALGIVVPIGTGVGAWLITREKSRADYEHRTAQVKEEAATQITNYLENVFSSADPLGVDDPGFRGTHPEESTRAMLDRGAELVRSHLGDQPVPRAGLLDAMGNAYRNLGVFDPAESMIAEAHQIRLRELGPDHELTAKSLHSLARLKQDRGEYDEAEQIYRQLLDMQIRQHGPESLPVARVKFFLGWVIFHRPFDGPVFDGARQAESEKHLRESLAIRRRDLAENDPDLGLTYLGLAAVKFTQSGQLNQLAALGFLTKARASFARSPRNAELGRVLGIFIEAENARQNQRNFEKAEPLYLEALRTSRTLLGQKHPLIVMQLGNLAGMYRAWGRMPEAFRMAKEALDLARTMPLRASPIIVGVLREGGDYFRDKGDLSQARQMYEEALQFAHERPRPNAAHIQTLEARLAALPRGERPK